MLSPALNTILESERLGPQFVVDWDFTPSRPSVLASLSRLKSSATGKSPFPAHEIIRTTPDRAARWLGYFIYLPDGRLDDSHRYTLSQFAAMDAQVAVCCAAPSIADVPEELNERCDHLIWKALGGYDFSAYALLIDTTARNSPGAELFIMNDSVLGPFGDLGPWLDRARWDLTGFLASAQFENHIQSFAFLLRNVRPETMGHFGKALSLAHAYDRYQDVINLQETRFSRIASRRMRVGAYLYAGDPMENASLDDALKLVRSGFPFLKKSLLGRYSALQDLAEIQSFLKASAHP